MNRLWLVVLLIVFAISGCASSGPVPSNEALLVTHVDKAGMKYQGPFNPYECDQSGQYNFTKDENGGIRYIQIPNMGAFIAGMRAVSKDIFPYEVMMIVSQRGIMSYAYFANDTLWSYTARPEFGGYSWDGPLTKETVEQSRRVFDFLFNGVPLTLTTGTEV